MLMLAVGAYGRAASREDWDAGRDFQIVGGPYFSIRDLTLLREIGYTEIHFFKLVDRRRELAFAHKVQ